MDIDGPPLMAAINTNLPANLEMLLKLGANPNLPLARSALIFYAVEFAGIEVVEVMLRYGADVGVIVGEKDCFSLAAARTNAPEIAELLKQYKNKT